MTPERARLLQRIFVSRHFAYADSLKRILEYLCEHAEGPDRNVKEYELAVGALRRPESFDPKKDPVVRVSVSAIRARLKAYFDGEGQAEPEVLTVPKGRYQALFAAREAAAPARPDRPGVRGFWAPYAAGGPNMVTYTEPLFFRDDTLDVYLRSIYVNDRNVPLEEARRRLPIGPAVPLRPCFHYLSSGEMQASVAITRLFQELALPLDMRNVRLLSLNDVRHANLILLGSVRTNHLIDALSGGPGIVMTERTLEDPAPPPGAPAVLRGTRYMDGKLPRSREYVLVTRRPGLAPGTTMTIIASHHGRAVQGVGTALTLESEVAPLLAAAGLVGDLPPHFQLLLEAEMIDLDDDVVSVRYVGHRTLG